MTEETEKARILMELVPLIQRKLMRLTGGAGGAAVTVDLRILMLLETKGHMMLSALARDLSVAKPNLVQPVTALEARGLVERETDRQDHRISRLSVTEDGRAHLSAHQDRVTAYLRQLEKKIPPSRREEFHAALKSLRDILDAME